MADENLESVLPGFLPVLSQKFHCSTQHCYVPNTKEAGTLHLDCRNSIGLCFFGVVQRHVDMCARSSTHVH